MDSHAALPQPVIDALARGWIVLTGNQRAARTLRRNFDLRQHTLGLTSWQPPTIIAWESWLTSLSNRLLLDGRTNSLLLNPSQEHILWRSVIATDPRPSILRSADSLADLAAAACSRAHAYRASHLLQAAANTTDTRAFARWAQEFERRCLRAQYITSAQLPEALITSISTEQVPLPTGILLTGFDSRSPLQAALLESVRTAGTPIDELHSAVGSAPRPLLVDAPDLNSELLACARWARTRLLENANSRIAIIVPDIDADRAAIDRAFRSVLAPHLNQISASTVSAPFEFSLGIPLSSTPIVADALDILRWAAGPLPLDRVSALLLSPYFAQSSASPQHAELLAHSEFDAFTLRDRPLLEPQITIDDLASLAARPKHAAQLSQLRAHLRSLSAFTRRSSLSRDRAYSDWATVFQQLLDAAGWAPHAALDTIEFQARSKWESALDELASLDFDAQAPRPSFENALDALTRIAGQMLFAPESRHAPIQIMGPLESAGSSFDALWFLRASDLTWPPAPAPNPLLPYSLQRDFAMPGAHAAVDTAYAHAITQRIAASAPFVAFSYAQYAAAGGRQRPSPLLSAFNIQPHTISDLAPEQLAAVPVPLDRILDNAPIPPPPAEALRGGASILQAQAACAFRAFAERRLFSTALEGATLGLDARDRGSIIHSVLHDFWMQVRTQAALRAMTATERDTLLAQCIQSALVRDYSRATAGWSGAYLNAERERLMRLLGLWLDFEAQKRTPFVVTSSEETLSGVSIGPLHLDIRVDRVDQTVPESPGDAAAEIILDYKTGLADPSAWEGDRPDAPQLPLYAVVSPAPHIAAVAFANVRRGEDMGLAGYQSRPGILPAAKKDHTRNLESQREDWRKVLTALAEDFHAGRALTSPKSYPETCRYCRQRILCRLDLTSLELDDEGDRDPAESVPLAATSAPEPQP